MRKFDRRVKEINKLGEYIRKDFNQNGSKFYYDQKTHQYWTDEYAKKEKKMIEAWSKEVEKKMWFGDKEGYGNKITRDPGTGEWITWSDNQAYIKYTQQTGIDLKRSNYQLYMQPFPEDFIPPDYTKKADPVIPPPTKEQMDEIMKWMQDYKRRIKKIYKPTLQQQFEAAKIKLERAKQRADNRKLAVVSLGRTKFIHAIDEMSGLAYKVDVTDGYKMTWMPLPRFIFVRWANLL